MPSDLKSRSIRMTKNFQIVLKIGFYPRMEVNRGVSKPGRTLLTNANFEAGTSNCRYVRSLFIFFIQFSRWILPTTTKIINIWKWIIQDRFPFEIFDRQLVCTLSRYWMKANSLNCCKKTSRFLLFSKIFINL